MRNRGARAGRAGTRVAHLPATTGSNPYHRLLYAQLLADWDVDWVGEGRLDGAWLWASRADVDVLHFHWRLDRLVDGGSLGPPPGAPHRRQRLVATVAFAARLTLARILGYRVVWTVHETHALRPGAPGFERPLGRVLARMSHGIVTHAPTLADDVARWARPTSPPQVAPVGRYEVTGTRDRQGVRRRLRLDDDTFVFLALGCMRADKRIPFLLQAFAAVTAPDVRLVVAGALLDADAAAALAAVRDPRVRWIGRVLDVDEVADLHAASDAAVLARAEDWTPSSMLHAQDHGLPVVAADLPSHRETLGPSWVRFTAGSPTSLASAMQDLASDPKRASAMGAAGRRGRGDWHASAAATAAAFGLHEPAPTAHRRGALITTGR